MTDNIERRLSQYNNGYSRTTKSYAPFILILSEAFADRRTARIREKQLKSGFGREYVKLLKNS